MPEDGIILRAFSIIGRKGEAEGAGAGHFIGLSLSLSLSLSSTWPDCVFHVHISFANMLKNAMMRKRQQNRMAFSAKRADKAAPSVAPSAKKTTIS